MQEGAAIPAGYCEDRLIFEPRDFGKNTRHWSPRSAQLQRFWQTLPMIDEPEQELIDVHSEARAHGEH
jgi:hypothetical protein